MIKVLILLLSIAIILLTLLQPSKSEGLHALSGNLSLFAVNKDRGTEKILSIVTAVLGALFIALSIIQM